MKVLKKRKNSDSTNPPAGERLGGFGTGGFGTGGFGTGGFGTGGFQDWKKSRHPEETRFDWLILIPILFVVWLVLRGLGRA